jgi:accessory gene regulator B
LYKKLSLIITDKFIHIGVIEKEKKAVYAYGFEILIATIFYTLIFFIAALITNSIIESIFFWVGFFIIRSISGGFHAKSYKNCHLLSLFNHLLFILAIKVLPLYVHSISSLVLNAFSIIMILIFAPVDHPNKPFIKNERKRFRALSCIYVVILVLISALSLVVPEYYDCYKFSLSIGTFSAAFALMSAKIKHIKEQKS